MLCISKEHFVQKKIQYTTLPFGTICGITYSRLPVIFPLALCLIFLLCFPQHAVLCLMLRGGSAFSDEEGGNHGQEPDPTKLCLQTGLKHTNTSSLLQAPDC